MHNSKPVRIQRKRTKGWKMPPNTVYVGRPSKWGNPFKVQSIGNRRGVYIITQNIKHGEAIDFKYKLYNISKFSAQIQAVKLFEKWIKQQIYWPIKELKGKNLACWCKEGDPCHADILLKLANE